ncbi:Protein of unknown function [Gryllus bimaculatus]|nr:Protein of unknown function [Gryllus bimaculatus]
MQTRWSANQESAIGILKNHRVLFRSAFLPPRAEPAADGRLGRPLHRPSSRSCGPAFNAHLQR